MSGTSCYGEKINIYNNPNFIPMPAWVSCIPPSMEIIAPAVLCQPPCGPPVVSFMPQPVNPRLSYYIYNDTYGNQPVSGCQSCQ